MAARNDILLIFDMGVAALVINVYYNQFPQFYFVNFIQNQNDNYVHVYRTNYGSFTQKKAWSWSLLPVSSSLPKIRA